MTIFGIYIHHLFQEKIIFLLPSILPLSVSGSHIFSHPTFSLQSNMVCRNLCDRLNSKTIFGKSHYEDGKKYCRRCEIYLFHQHILVTDDSNKGKDFHTCSSLPSVFIANAYFFLLLPLLHLYIV